MPLIYSHDFDLILKRLNDDLLEQQKQCLSDAEILVLQGVWKNQTYQEIAQQVNYSSAYLTNCVAPSLWRRLGEVIGQRVTKKNCRALLECHFSQPAPTAGNPSYYRSSQQASSQQLLRYPSGAVPLNSPFYVERFPIEQQTYEEITKSGALVRIKAPRELGKTSLLMRLLDHGNRLGCATVNLDLQQADQNTLSDINRFLRWFCTNLCFQLNLESKIDEYWDKDLGSSVSCTLYLRYILEQIDTPLLITLDESNQLFEYSQVVKDFFPLLRSWYEETKKNPLWEKLRLVIAYSTEIYVPLQLNQSPFNVGFPIELSNFNFEQVKELAQRYELSLNDQQLQQLMSIIDGHPALVNLAFYSLNQGKTTLSELIDNAASYHSIYSYHLQRHQATLQQKPELAEACDRVMSADEPIELEPILAYQLYSMGLIDLYQNKAVPRVPLYKQIFQQHLNSK